MNLDDELLKEINTAYKEYDPRVVSLHVELHREEEEVQEMNLATVLLELRRYQPEAIVKEVYDLVSKGVERPGSRCTLTLAGPHDSGKSITTHFIKCGLGIEQCVPLNLSMLKDHAALDDIMGVREERPRELTLAQRLSDAAVNNPSIILLIIDDLHLAPQLLLNIKSLLDEGYLATFNGAYFKLPVETTLLTVMTCDYEHCMKHNVLPTAMIRMMSPIVHYTQRTSSLSQ